MLIDHHTGSHYYNELSKSLTNLSLHCPLLVNIRNWPTRFWRIP
jgi:hypothetical protein